MDLSSLNNKQREAVVNIGGPMLVFAGAGSGKTRVLTYKIAYLIEKIGLPPENILAVTFTNKAAQEMKSRVHELVNLSVDGITIGTFHSIGAYILRKNISVLGYTSDFTIYDQADSKALIKQTIKDLNFDLKLFDPRSVQTYISNAKNKMQNPKDFLKFSSNIKEEKIAKIYSIYQESLKKNNAVDFDDLLNKPLEIFDKFQEILLKYQKQFKYILVDEYQDTNKPQFDLIKLLSNINKDVFVVGDDDQSIYGWRGADISNILNFKNSYNNAKIIKLEQNYRSTQNILDAAWSVVSKNINRAEKKLWTENDKGSKINLFSSYNELDESNKILQNIVNSVKSLDLDYNKIVILYRTNAQSRVIEDALRKSNIPYKIIGGVKFYDRKEVKDILAYLRLICNKKDSVSLDRIINFPSRGIGATTLDKLHEFSKINNIFTSFEEISNLPLGKKQLKGIELFINMINKYNDRSKNDSPSSILKDLLDDLNLNSYYSNLETSDSLERWMNIEECLSSIVEYENNATNPTLNGYLEDVSLLTDIDKWNSKENAVTMMTIHSSKGLEFDDVYITGLEEGLFPITKIFNDDDIEEERRLFYVALTRAQRNVTLSYAKSRRKFGSEPILTQPSRFINEISVNLLNNKISDFDKFKTKGKLSNTIDSTNVIKVNQIVNHKLFGKGKVENIEGAGENSKITILFFNNQRKKLIYKYANLEILG